MRGKGGVVTAAMLHMQNQRNIQYLSFQRRIFTVRTQNMQDVFGIGQLKLGLMDIETFPVMVVIVSLIAIDGEHREQGDQLQTLS